MLPVTTDLVIPPSVTKTFKLIGYGLVLALLIGTHTAVYMKGRSDVEAKYASATVEQLEEDITDNAERIERQVTTLSNELAASRAQNRKLQEAIDANQTVNTNPACDLSDDEFRLFNDAVSETQRGVPDGGVGALLSAKSSKESKRGGAED